MSTPVQSLPRGAAPPAGPSAVDDPVVRDVLMMEMESEVAAASASKGPSPPHAPPAYYMPRAAPHPPPSGGAAWLNTDYAQRAAVAALIAVLLLHPAAGDMLSARVALLGNSATYNLAARAALLAVVLYLLMWKLQL